MGVGYKGVDFTRNNDWIMGNMDKELTLLIAAFMKKIVVMWLFVCKKSCDNILDAHCFPCAKGSNGFLL